MKKAKKIVTPDHQKLEFRRWCVEQAMRWPTDVVYPNAGSALGAINQTYASRIEADVIGRAKKIHDWVTAAT